MSEHEGLSEFEPGELGAQTGASFERLVRVMQRLLAPDGCPWDREQDERSLRRYVLEEACEVIDAIDSADDAGLCEELGDLALQVAFLAELARRRGAFGPDDVMLAICNKLVRRHPHVFADGAAHSAAEVETNWERIKEQERAQDAARGLLSGIPRSLPALTRAHQTSVRASRVGFDWPSGETARAKVDEELSELDAAVAAHDVAHMEEELGDLLFAIVAWSRHLGLQPELALRKACDKFADRFAYVERRVADAGGWPLDEAGKPTLGLELRHLDELWERAKRR